MSDEKKTKTVFPLRLEEDLNKSINKAVFLSEAKSKHQYIIDAVVEKMQRDLKESESSKKAE